MRVKLCLFQKMRVTQCMSRVFRRMPLNAKSPTSSDRLLVSRLFVLSQGRSGRVSALCSASLTSRTPFKPRLLSILCKVIDLIETISLVFSYRMLSRATELIKMPITVLEPITRRLTVQIVATALKFEVAIRTATNKLLIAPLLVGLHLSHNHP